MLYAPIIVITKQIIDHTYLVYNDRDDDFALLAMLTL